MNEENLWNIYICNSETEGKAHSFNTYIELFCISIL